MNHSCIPAVILPFFIAFSYPSVSMAHNLEGVEYINYHIAFIPMYLNVCIFLLSICIPILFLKSRLPQHSKVVYYLLIASCLLFFICPVTYLLTIHHIDIRFIVSLLTICFIAFVISSLSLLCAKKWPKILLILGIACDTLVLVNGIQRLHEHPALILLLIAILSILVFMQIKLVKKIEELNRARM